MVKSERRVGVGSQRSQEKCLALKTITILSFDDDDYWKKNKRKCEGKNLKGCTGGSDCVQPCSNQAQQLRHALHFSTLCKHICSNAHSIGRL